MLSGVEHEKKFYDLGARLTCVFSNTDISKIPLIMKNIVLTHLLF